MTAVGPVRFEHRDDPLGIGTGTPRLSWRVRTDDPDWAQTGYELSWDGGPPVRVDSAEQVLVPWPFPPLPSRGRAEVRVRVAHGDDWSDWSPPSTVEAGLLSPDDWTARFVAPRTTGGPAPVVARTVRLRGPVASARLYTTAHGLYRAGINGHRVGDDELAPGWTSYAHRLRYQTHDVTALLDGHEAAIELVLGNGWYRGRIGWYDGSAFYGDRLAALAQLEIGYADGGTETIGTDGSWTARTGTILADDLYDGQRTDLTGAAGGTPEPVDVLDGGLDVLVAADGPPVRVTGTVPAQRIWRPEPGRTLVDFGQNLVGRVRLRVPASGGEVTVRHAEVLDGGELAVRPLRSAKATDSYLLPDGGREVELEPAFTFHGFRYAEVTGPPELAADAIEAVVLGSGLRRTGWFDCSDAEVNRLHDNVVWSMRGNFLDVPTDCPQRDERMGWTGDVSVFSPTATFLFDTAGFLTSWLADLAADQGPDGGVPFVVPDVLPTRVASAAGWGDAATVVPWVLYRRFGDTGLLARQFGSMARWVDHVAGLTTDGVWAGGFQFGDWLDPTAPPDTPDGARADHDVVATAHLARSAGIVADAARVLGREADADRYAALAAATREAFAREYVSPAGRIVSDAPTCYALALEWALLPTATARERAGRRLADLVRGDGFRVGTGFLGTPLVTDALCHAGRPDLAYRLLTERSCPSWLYPVTMGATTVWERWDALLPDGSLNPGEMLSFNHYALGAVADWMHRTVAGLAPAAPGYREITVTPVPDAALTHASARHDTPYGEAAVSWRRAGGRLTLDVTVPPGATATVHPPGAAPVRVRHGRHSWTVADPCAARPAPVRTIRDLLDAAGLWPRAVALLIGRGLATDAADAARRAARDLDAPVGALPAILAFGPEPDAPARAEAARQALADLLD